MAVILALSYSNPVGQRHYVTGADADGNVTFSENEADALEFADGIAASNFADEKKIFAAVKATVDGRKRAAH